jgi:restriction endonuclease Mrr
MLGIRPGRDFPYSFPEYLSPVLRILGDGEDHSIEEIRRCILAEFPLTPEQLLLKRAGHNVTVFINKVALAFNRLVLHKAIVQAVPESYRITDHGREVLKRRPNDARERDL